MDSYTSMKRTHQQRVSRYLENYAFFAFSEEQFRKGLEKLGVSGAGVLAPLGNSGGYILKDKAEGFYQLTKELEEETRTALADPIEGEKFAFDMFYHELANHEYGYTGDEEETLDALGLSREEVEKSPILSSALKKAKQKLMEVTER